MLETNSFHMILHGIGLTVNDLKDQVKPGLEIPSQSLIWQLKN